MVAPRIAVEPRGARRRTLQSEGCGDLLRDDTGLFEALHHRRGVPKQLDGRLCVGEGAIQPLEQSARRRRLEIEPRAARANEAAPEAAAAELRRQVQEVAADPAAVGGRRQEADVAR